VYVWGLGESGPGAGCVQGLLGADLFCFGGGRVCSLGHGTGRGEGG